MHALSYVSTCREDYLYAHSGAVPSLEGAASQLNILKKEQGLRSVFLATDAPLEGKYIHTQVGGGSVYISPLSPQTRRR